MATSRIAQLCGTRLLLLLLLSVVTLTQAQHYLIETPGNFTAVIGERFSRVCRFKRQDNTTSGSPVPDLEFHQENGQLGSIDPTSILRNAAQISDAEEVVTITYRSFQRKEAGTYTCLIRGRNTFTLLAKTQYIVETAIPPRVDAENVTATNGQTATVSCTAIGLPLPSITLRHPDGHVVANGTLMVSHLIPAVTGNMHRAEYTCEAINKAGINSTTAVMFVPYAPILESISPNQTHAIGRKLTLECIAQGYPQVQAYWQHNGTNITNADQQTNKTISRENLDQVTFTLEMDSFQAGFEGDYHCLVTNSQGSTSDISTVSAIYPPETPPRPSKLSISQNLIKLNWAHPKSVNDVINLYEVSYQIRGSTNWTVNTFSLGTNKAFQVVAVSLLSEWTYYKFRVRARNSAGWSDYSPPSVYYQTLPSVPPVPDKPFANSTAPTAISVVWELSAWEPRHGEISEFEVTYWESGTTAQKKIVVQSSSAFLENLKKGTEYTFSVKVSNGFYWSLQSDESQATTDITAPGQFLDISAVAKSHEKVFLRWGNLSDTGGSPLVRLKISYKAENTSQWVTLPSQPDVTASEFEVTQLQELTTYTFRVAAFNAVGKGHPTVRSQPVTTLDFQHPPDVISANTTKMTPSTVDITFSLSAQSFIVPIVHFEASIMKIGGSPFIQRLEYKPLENPDDEYSHTLMNLDHSTDYSVTLTARNEYGLSQSPAVLTFTTPDGTPPKPVKVRVDSLTFKDMTVFFEVADSPWPLEHVEFMVFNTENKALVKTGKVKYQPSITIDISQLQPGTSYRVELYTWTAYARSIENGQVLFSAKVPPTTRPTNGDCESCTSVEKSESDDNTVMIIIIVASAVGPMVVLILILLVAARIRQRRRKEKALATTWAQTKGGDNGASPPPWNIPEPAKPVETTGYNQTDGRWGSHEQGLDLEGRAGQGGTMFGTDRTLAGPTYDHADPKTEPPTTFTSFGDGHKEENVYDRPASSQSTHTEV